MMNQLVSFARQGSSDEPTRPILFRRRLPTLATRRWRAGRGIRGWDINVRPVSLGDGVMRAPYMTATAGPAKAAKIAPRRGNALPQHGGTSGGLLAGSGG